MLRCFVRRTGVGLPLLRFSSSNPLSSTYRKPQPSTSNTSPADDKRDKPPPTEDPRKKVGTGFPANTTGHNPLSASYNRTRPDQFQRRPPNRSGDQSPQQYSQQHQHQHQHHQQQQQQQQQQYQSKQRGSAPPAATSQYQQKQYNKQSAFPARTPQQRTSEPHQTPPPTAPVTESAQSTPLTPSVPATPRRALKPKKVVDKIVKLSRGVTVRDLSKLIGAKAYKVKRVVGNLLGQPPKSTESVVPLDIAQMCVIEFGMDPRVVTKRRKTNLQKPEHKDRTSFPVRPPIVTIMGHVDHGKTTLLDKLRGSHVAASEAGGITQTIAAFRVVTPSGESCTFIDTPGHAAFARMRSRGARVTDLVILVVSAIDGVMPQTIEAIQHCRDNDVTMVVAINKCDVVGADPDLIRRQLMEQNVMCEELGGDVQMVEISAKTGMGLPSLIESVLLQSMMLDVRADAECPADGFILEASIQHGIGPNATVIVLNGTLRVGDCIVAGAAWGKVRAMTMDKKPQKSVGPGLPVQVTGLKSLPTAGDDVIVVESEARAKEVIRIREEIKNQHRLKRLSTLAQAVAENKCKEQCVIIKADTLGSVEAITDCIEAVPLVEVAMRVVRSGVGAVTESDIQEAAAFDNVLIYSFNVKTPSSVLAQAKAQNVVVRSFDIIYRLLDDIRETLSGLLEPTRIHSVKGKATVQDVFEISGRRQRHDSFKIAGCRIVEGTLKRSDTYRIYRNGEQIHEGGLESMRQFKLSVTSVVSGTECGLHFANFQEFQVGDVVEAIDFELIPRTLPADIFTRKTVLVDDNAKLNMEEDEAEEEDAPVKKEKSTKKRRYVKGGKKRPNKSGYKTTSPKKRTVTTSRARAAPKRA